MSGTVTVEASEADAGRRVDVVLAAGLEGVSRTKLQRYIESGLITLNGKPVNKRYLAAAGDAFVCLLPGPEPYEAAAEDIPLDIVYEDSEIIVINKPRGMVVHPAPGHYTGTLVNALLYRFGNTLPSPDDKAKNIRPGIVHRLDMDTSGLLIAAKTDAAHLSLTAQLAEHNVLRVYNAVVCGGFNGERLTVDLPIGRHPSDRTRMAVIQPKNRGPSGRRAVTHITVLERFGKYTLIEARLETGRTHQIRVHTAHIGRPVLGDAVYGAARQPFGLTAQVLHAKTLGFTHPATGERMLFDTELPEYFNGVLERVRKV